jgi:HAD superfamily hydrolase (TIGR01509 family)
MRLDWDIITPHYPPNPGGIADYTQLLAAELRARGDSVTVWCPFAAGRTAQPNGVRVFPVLDRFKLSELLALDRRWAAERERSRRILLMYHPHGLGCRNMNIPFCLWLWKRAAINRDRVVVILHERATPFGQGPWKHILVAVAHRIMLAVTLQAAAHVWAPVSAWVEAARRWALGRNVCIAWLPVFSNIPLTVDDKRVAGIRSRLLAAGEVLVGHFGVCPHPITRQLDVVLPTLLRSHPNVKALLVGARTEEYGSVLRAAHPDLTPRIHSLGLLSPAEISVHLQACDVLLLPYPEGVNARRTIAVTGLAHGIPIMTTFGPLSEPFWLELPSVRTVPAGDSRALAGALEALLRDPPKRDSGSRADRAYFAENFTLGRIVQQLRSFEISPVRPTSGFRVKKPALRLVEKKFFLFDLDGTLVDSSALHEKAFRQVLHARAPECLDGFDYDLLKGKSTVESFRELGIAGQALEAALSEKQGLYRNAVLAGELRLMPGAREILEFLQARGKQLFLVTGGSRGSVETALNATGIRAFFEGIVTAEDVEHGKPAPDCYLRCLEQFGLAADQAVGVEDSLNGVQACRAAGLEVILVSNQCSSVTVAAAFPGLIDLWLALFEDSAWNLTKLGAGAG